MLLSLKLIRVIIECESFSSSVQRTRAALGLGLELFRRFEQLKQSLVDLSDKSRHAP